MGTRLGLDGYPVHSLFRIPRDPRVRATISRFLPYFHQKIILSIPRRMAVKRILHVLRKNEIVFILADNLKRGKVDSRLFGQRVCSARGPVSLALRSGAPVVPVYVVRTYEGKLHLIIEPEMTLTRNGSLSADIANNTQRVVGYLENLIRRYPDQWNWLTIRMRRITRPAGAAVS